jgi:hypothetical protein
MKTTEERCNELEDALIQARRDLLEIARNYDTGEIAQFAVDKINNVLAST